MAICFRRVFKNYNSLPYSSIRNQLNVNVEQRNGHVNVAPVVEANQEFYNPLISNVNTRIERQNVSGIGTRSDFRCIAKENVQKNEIALLQNELRCDNLFLMPLPFKEILYCAKECNAYQEEEAPKETVSSPVGRPDLSQLEKILHTLSEDLPNIFSRSLDPNIYHENLIFENNIRGTTTIGIKNYLKQIAFLKIYAHLRYSQVTLEILKITSHLEDGTVRVRWRVKGIPGLRVFVLLWKHKFRRERENIENEDGWYDGFSIFYVKGDGLVHKHVVHKMIPDDSRSLLSNPLAGKLILVGGHEVDVISAPFAAREIERLSKTGYSISLPQYQ